MGNAGEGGRGCDPVSERARLPSGMTPRLLSRERAAAYCGISPSLFDEYLAVTIPPVGIGRRKLWDVKALDRWLDAQSGPAQRTRSTEIGRNDD